MSPGGRGVTPYARERTKGGRRGVYAPGRLQDLGPHNGKLGHDADDVEMRPVGKQKVPQPEHLGEGRRAGAESQDGRKGVDFGRKPLGRQVHAELGVDNGQDLVDEGEAAVDAVHGAANIGRTLAREERVKGNKGLGLAASGVEKGRSEDVHALHVGSGFRARVGLCSERVSTDGVAGTGEGAH